MDINKLKANFDSGAMSNRFSVNMFGPGGIKLEGIRCESTTLPGRSLTTKDFHTEGTAQKKVTQVNNVNEVDFTFRCDSSFFDRYIIEAWQYSIFTAEEGNSMLPVFKYPKDYYGTLEVTQFRRDDSEALKYTFHEAFPVSYEAMTLSMDEASLLKFQCKFAFRTFDTEYGDAPQLSVLNKGRRYLDLARESLTVASRFSGGAKSMLGKLNNLDSAGSRLSNILGGGI